jgi:hypothetical protein
MLQQMIILDGDDAGWEYKEEKVTNDTEASRER